MKGLPRGGGGEKARKTARKGAGREADFDPSVGLELEAKSIQMLLSNAGTRADSDGQAEERVILSLPVTRRIFCLFA